MNVDAQLDIAQAVELCATDGLLFSYFFLPETFSLPPGEYHEKFFEILDNTENQFISVAVFRDGGKTTIARSAVMRRLCYAISRTMLIVSESKPHSTRTLRWVASKIRNSPVLAATFGLSIGAKENDEELIIHNSRFGVDITLIAQGITGQVRGINVNDSRPDFILVDDAGSDENMATDIQRDKIAKLFFGAVENSLAARSINPHAQIMNITTRHADDDLHGLCEKDPRYKTFSLGVFNEHGKSTWESKFPTEQLYRDKQAAIARRQLSTWMREKENQIVRTEEAAFDGAWLKFNSSAIPDHDAWVYFIGFDPSNPPSDLALAKGLPNKDFAVFSVLAFRAGRCHLVVQKMTKKPDPLWERETFLQLVDTYKPLAAGVESVAYQRTSARLLATALQEVRKYVRIEEIVDRRKKVVRIHDEISPLAYSGGLEVHPACTDFITAYETFPGCKHFDPLDSVVMGLLACRAYAGGLHYPSTFGGGSANKLTRMQTLEQQLAEEKRLFGTLDNYMITGGPP